LVRKPLYYTCKVNKGMMMYKVIYKIYGKYSHVYSFESYEQAKKFFHEIRKSPKVTYAELDVA